MTDRTHEAVAAVEALAGMVRRWEASHQNWTQAAVDAQRSGNRDLYVQITNTVLTALAGFPIEQAKAALRSDEQRDGWRPEVVAFANLMEHQLRANDHKPGWKSDDPDVLYRRFLEEAGELDHAVYGWNGPTGLTEAVHREMVGREAADVANFAMMIADVCGALATADAPKVEKCPECGRDVLGEDKAATGFMANCGRRLARLEQCRAGGCTADAPAVSGEGK